VDSKNNSVSGNRKPGNTPLPSSSSARDKARMLASDSKKKKEEKGSASLSR
jgi:hypothetical protein